MAVSRKICLGRRQRRWKRWTARRYDTYMKGPPPYLSLSPSLTLSLFLFRFIFLSPPPPLFLSLSLYVHIYTYLYLHIYIYSGRGSEGSVLVIASRKIRLAKRPRRWRRWMGRRYDMHRILRVFTHIYIYALICITS